MKPLRILYLHNCGFGIPPKGYGAIENIVWQYMVRLRKRGHRVDEIKIPRTLHLPRFLWRVATTRPDVVHVHFEYLVPMARHARRFGAKVVATSHSRLPYPVVVTDADLDRNLRMYSQASFHAHLSETFVEAFRSMGLPVAPYEVLPNGVEVDAFRFAPEAGNGRVVCVGKVCERKGQHIVVRRLGGGPVPFDFVGPIADDEPIEDAVRAATISAWDRATLYERLTDYSVLVLMSESEGQPLVILEAFAAGLSVVVSRAAAANLDESLPFVTVLDDEAGLPAAVERAVAENAALRPAIRRYAEETFGYERILDRYEAALRKPIV